MPRRVSLRGGFTGIAVTILAPALIALASAAEAAQAAQPTAAPTPPRAAAPAAPANAAAPAQGETRIDAKAELKGVLIQPADDFNLTRTEIPPGLLPIVANPYGLRPNMTCAQLEEEIVYIDTLVGPDIGPPTEDDNSLLSDENKANAARNIARSAASSWIPFRGVVREITGAEAHARAFKEAVLAGMVRRGFLKGIREHQRCAAARPAAATPAAARPAAAPAAARPATAAPAPLTPATPAR